MPLLNSNQLNAVKMNMKANSIEKKTVEARLNSLTDINGESFIKF